MENDTNKRVKELEDKVKELQEILDKVFKTERYIFEKTVQFSDGRNIQTGRTTGTKIGTATDQKVGFFNKTPVVQQGAISAPTGGAVIDAPARTAINSIITTLQTLGLTA